MGSRDLPVWAKLDLHGIPLLRQSGINTFP